MERLYRRISSLLLSFMALALVALIVKLSHPNQIELRLAPNFKANDGMNDIQVPQKAELVEFKEKGCNLKVHLNKNLSTDHHAVPAGQGYIIYTCRGSCGGLADRLQGIMTTYSIAKQTGRLFRIEETSRCSLTRFLRPSPWYNWTLDRKPLRNLSSCMLTAMKGRFTKDNDFVQYLNENVIYMQTNKRTDRLRPNFREIFYTLFVFDSSIVNEIQIFKSTSVKNNKTVCTHIRIGKSATFNDMHYSNLGNLSALWLFLSSYDKDGFLIYIASDSTEVLASTRTRYNKRFIEIAGPINHIDYSTDDKSCSEFRKLMLDFVFLTQCDILVLTSSNMGKRISELRYNTNDQYCFQSGKVYSCPFYHFKKYTRSNENFDPVTGI